MYTTLFTLGGPSFWLPFGAAAGQTEISTNVWMAFLIGVLLLGLLAFLLYRWVDLRQYSFIKEAAQPEDLEQLTKEVFEDKRKRKRSRTLKAFFKATFSWGTQAAYTFPGMFALAIFLQNKEISDGAIYNILMVTTFVINMLVSKLFAVWTPSRPYACRAFQQERTWTLGNMSWQAWGVVSWAVPTYFFYSAYGVDGWIGSVLFLTISQLLQLIFFIYSTKSKAIPYQQYDGLSAEFKGQLQAYLKSQGIADNEVGVLPKSGLGPNAFATSLTGWYKQIVMTEELIQGYQDPTNPAFTLKLGDDTLEAVIAHEVGHIKNHHVEKSVILGIIFSSVVTIAVYTIFSHVKAAQLNQMLHWFHASWSLKADTSQQLLLYWGQSLFNVMLVYPLTFVMLAVTRRNERQADTHLLNTNGCKNGQDFFHQIRHIAPVPNLPAWERCNATHPPAKEREERMKKWHDEHCTHG